MNNITLISFASNSKWYNLQKILNDSAITYNISNIISYTDSYKEWDFVKKYKDISEETRGYGF